MEGAWWLIEMRPGRPPASGVNIPLPEGVKLAPIAYHRKVYDVPEFGQTSEDPAERTPFWERLNSLFTRDESSAHGADEPPRKGFAITVSILVSTLLWFTFSMRETYQALIVMPTEIVNLPGDEALRSPPPDAVRVQVEGEGLSLIRLRLNPQTIPINAANDEVILRDVVPELLKSVRVQSVSPSSVNLQKEVRIRRKIPIEPRLTINMPGTHLPIGSPTLSPDSVEVSGAASVVTALDSWPTRHLVVENLRDTLRRSIALSDTLSGLVQRGADETTVTVVAALFTEASREVDVIVTGQPSHQRLVTLEPASVRVTYRVLFSQFEEAQTAPDFFATVSYDEIRSDTTGRVKPQLHLPEHLNIEDAESDPASLRYYQRLE